MVNQRMSKSLHQYFFLVVKFTFTTPQQPIYSTKLASVFVYTLGVTLSKFCNCKVFSQFNKFVCLQVSTCSGISNGLLNGFLATLVWSILRD